MLKNGIHFPIAVDGKNKLFASLRKSSKEMACKVHNKIVCDYITKTRMWSWQQYEHLGCQFDGACFDNLTTQTSCHHDN